MASRPRRVSQGMGMATVGAIATLKPRPPSSPRSSLADITTVTNGAAGLLAGKGGPGSDVEVARLSQKIMDLMQQLNARDAEHRRLEKELEAARKEVANVKALVASGAPVAASRPQSPQLASSASSSRARMPAPRPTTSTSPKRADAMLKILTAALHEADVMTANKAEELAAARAMLHHRSHGPSPAMAGGDTPAVGVVAKLQAELAEAAEERRNLRAQLQVRACVHDPRARRARARVRI
jgi:hypothetical protein